MIGFDIVTTCIFFMILYLIVFGGGCTPLG